MSEEIGEFWNIIKRVGPDVQKKLVAENKEEVENFIGGMLFLTLKISYLCNVDSQKAIDNVMAEYEKRFPKKETKGRHANLKAGGIDLKEQR